MLGHQVIILELTTTHLKLIGQLLHMHFAANPHTENNIGKDLLDELLAQTDVVYKEPEKHYVYPVDGNVHPFDAIISNAVWYKPVEAMPWNKL